MIRPNRYPGISMSEYAIIMALVVVIGIAALAMVGVNVNVLLGNMIAGGDGKDAGKGTNGTQTPINVDQISTIQIVQGPDGSITYQVTLNTGAGSQVTSAPGDQIVLAMVRQMEAEIARQQASGSVDPAVVAALKAFKNDMNNYQKALSRYLASEAQYDQETARIQALESKGQYSPPPYHSSASANDVFAQTETFLNMTQSFQELQGLISGKPQYSDLQSSVNDIAGMVSTVAIADQMAETSQGISPNRINPSDLGNLIEHYPESLNFLAGIQSQTGEQVSGQPGTAAYQSQFNAAFRNNVMATSTNQWMGTQNVTEMANL